MEKHLMLLFLSDVKIDRGTGEVKRTRYEGPVGETQTTNESAVRYFRHQGIAFDRMFALVSQKVRTERLWGSAFDALPEREKPTHLSYFKQRIADVYPQIETQDFFVDCPYDEGMPAHALLPASLEIARTIMDYVASVRTPGVKVYLHVDLTGGMRHTNMMLLSIMRLLEYNEVTTKTVLYSDYQKGRVEEVDEIYQLFDVVAGAEEFVRFGSVDVLSKYFDKQPETSKTPELSELLEAMRQFSEEIKLCHRGSFVTAAEELQRAIRAFSATGEETGPASTALMRRLESRIRADYREILEGSDDRMRPALVRWCLTHDLVQQALTLYVEAMPGYWVDRKFVRITKRGEGVDKNARHETAVALLTEVPPASENADRSKAHTYAVKELKALLVKKCAPEDALREVGRISDELAANYRAGFKSEEDVRGLMRDLLDPQRAVDGALEENRAYRLYRDILEQRGEDVPEQLSLKKLRNRLHDFDQKTWATCICPVDVLMDYRWERLREAGNIELFLPPETCGRLLRDYVRIRDERNQVNHARTDAGSFVSADELKDYMRDALEFLEAIVVPAEA